MPTSTTERTLIRRCERGRGMGFAEWRQRLRVLTPACCAMTPAVSGSSQWTSM